MMLETLVVRTFGVDVSDDKVASDIPWKIGRLYPWLFAKDSPVCFLGVGRGWRGIRRNGSFRSHAALKAIPFDGPLTARHSQRFYCHRVFVLWFGLSATNQVSVFWFVDRSGVLNLKDQLSDSF
jgi:hypothetical protein